MSVLELLSLRSFSYQDLSLDSSSVGFFRRANSETLLFIAVYTSSGDEKFVVSAASFKDLKKEICMDT